nr:hypothetical protein [Tanacetum cinerariifolium]
ETIHKEKEDKMERAATTASNLKAEQDSGTINRTQSTAILNEPIPQETGSENNKNAQDLEITHLKKRVNRLEKKRKSRTTQLKRRLFKVGIESSAVKSLGDQEDASNQRGITEMKRFNFINLTAGEPVTTLSAPVTTGGVSVGTAKPRTPLTTTTLIEDEDLIIAQTLMKIRSVKSKEKSKETGVSSTRLTRGVIMKEANYKLAQRLQAKEQGELTIEERSKLFVELMDKRKKHFAKLRAEKIRRKPPTKAQKRNQMCTYLKNMANYKHSQLNNKSFKDIQMLFDNTIKWINLFVPMDSEALESTGRSSELEIILREGNRHLRAGREGVSIIKRNSYIDFKGDCWVKRLLSGVKVTVVDMEVTTTGPERQPDDVAGALAAAKDAPAVDEGAQADPTLVQELQQSIVRFRGDVDRSIIDQSRFTTWMLSCTTQLMDASGRTNQAFGKTIVGSS